MIRHRIYETMYLGNSGIGRDRRLGAACGRLARGRSGRNRSSDIRGLKGNVVELFAEDLFKKGCLPRLPWTGQDCRGKLGYGLF